MAVLRVIDTAEQQTSEGIDTSYGTEGLNLTDDQPGKYEFSVKEQVIRDLQTQQAFAIANSRADELAGWIKDADWESAVKRYNNAYCPAPAEPNSPENPLKLKIESLKDQSIASQLEIDNAFRVIDLNPASAGFIQQRLVTSILNRRLYEMLGENKAIGPVAAALPFEPAPAVYVVKSVKRKPPTTKDLLDNKAFAAYRLNIIDSVGLGLIHFNPKNIIKRTNFVLIKEATLPASRQEEMPPIGD
jgi:hypothetical protein